MEVPAVMEVPAMISSAVAIILPALIAPCNDKRPEPNPREAR
jgi:hypothetical protein